MARRFGAGTAVLAAAFVLFTPESHAQVEARATDASVDAARAELVKSGERYRQILNSPGLSTGVYILEAGTEDRQRPHERDEVYYVLSGRALLVSGPDTLEATPGRALFVPARLTHRFVDIQERLELLVFFGSHSR